MYKVIENGIEIGFVEKKPLKYPSSLSYVEVDAIPKTISIETIEEQRIFLKKQLWSLLPRKVIEAKKQIIGKSVMTDEELKTQLDIYERKYQDSLDGLDVFEAQAMLLGISQEAFRVVVVEKANEFKLAEKKINDSIESVRQILEEQIDKVEDREDFEKIKAKIVMVDEFSILTPVEEIFGVLNA